MAVLTDGDRSLVRKEFSDRLSIEREPIGLNKADVRLAINAVDQWVDDNQASFNSALPAAARNGLTAAQKARLLMFVVERRFKEGA